MSDDWNEIIGAGFPGPGFKRAVGRGRGRGRGLLNVEKENSVGGQFKFNSVQGNEQNGFESMGSISEDWGDCKPMESTFGKKPFSMSNNTQIDLADNKLNQRTFGQKAFSISNEGAENWDGDMPDKGGFGQKSFTQSENNTEDWGGTNTKNATFRNTGFRSSANGSSENKTGFRHPGGSTGFSNTSDVHFGGGFNKRRNDNREDFSASGRSGKGSCYKCGEEGHIARDCPQGGSRGGGSGACYKCGEEGHIARDCPQGGGQGRGSCYNCGKGGHMSRDCQSNRSGKFGGSRTDDSGRPGTEKPPENYIPPPPSENEQEIFKTLEQGINFDKYDEIKVFVTGRDAPQRGISSFTEADLHEIVQQNVLRAKYSKPTPVQKHAVPVIMQNRDLMACAQTGSGKTAAFLLPVLTKMLRDGLDGSSFSEIQEPQAIIIGPTRELVVQIYNEARKFAYNTMLRPVVVYGGTSVSYQLQQVSRGAHMVVGTPGRLKDFIQRGKISLAKVKYLILDEADRMLDMGFEPIVRQIVEQMGMTGKDSRQTLMFSATFPEEIQKLASDFLMDHIFITVGRVGGANLDIKQVVYQVEKNEKREKLVSILNEMGTSRTLVFVEQKRSTDFLAAFLCQFDFPATSIHGDRYQSQREEALADFKSGRKPILVATSVASRGLDIPGVEHVVNFDLPKSIDEYVHRIGRTGRCGNLGKATSFFDPQVDAEIAQPLVNILTDAQQEVPEWLADTAERSYCTATNYSGKYGGRDIRKKQNKTAYSDDFNAGAFNDGFPSSLEDPAVEEEIWDI